MTIQQHQQLVQQMQKGLAQALKTELLYYRRVWKEIMQSKDVFIRTNL